MLKQFKKFKRLILKSTLKTKSFLILFALFFSSLAFAASLTVTWLDGRIPLHNSTCTNSDREFVMNKDSTEFIHEVQRQFNWTSLLEPIYVNNFRKIILTLLSLVDLIKLFFTNIMVCLNRYA